MPKEHRQGPGLKDWQAEPGCTHGSYAQVTGEGRATPGGHRAARWLMIFKLRLLELTFLGAAAHMPILLTTVPIGTPRQLCGHKSCFSPRHPRHQCVPHGWCVAQPEGARSSSPAPLLPSSLLTCQGKQGVCLRCLGPWTHLTNPDDAAGFNLAGAKASWPWSHAQAEC